MDAWNLHWFKNMFTETLDEFLKYSSIISGSVGYRAAKCWKPRDCSGELLLYPCPCYWTPPKAQQRWDTGIYINLFSDPVLLVLCCLCTNWANGLKKKNHWGHLKLTFFYSFGYHKQELLTFLLLLPEEQLIYAFLPILFKLHDWQVWRENPC